MDRFPLVLLTTTTGQLVLLWVAGRQFREVGWWRDEEERRAGSQATKQKDRQANKQQVSKPVDQSVNQSFINQSVHRLINPLGQTPFDRGISCKRDGLKGGGGKGQEGDQGTATVTKHSRCAPPPSSGTLAHTSRPMSPRLAGYGSYKSIRAGPLCNLGCISLQPAVHGRITGTVAADSTLIIQDSSNNAHLASLLTLFRHLLLCTLQRRRPNSFDAVRPRSIQYDLDNKEKRVSD